MNKNNILFFIIALASFSNLKAQEHLEPVDGIFALYDHQFEYYPKVREILLKDLYDSPEARFLVLPSFDGEMSVDLKNELNKYSLEYRKATPSIWYSLSDKKVEVKIQSVSKPISKDDAELIINLFKKSMKNVAYPENEIYGLDGTSYYFSSETKSGKIWSPKSNSKMAMLVEIGEDLIAFCFSKELNFSEDFKTRIKKLTTKL